MNYRKEIDSIRGISVILVILYHANIKIFGGGYIGVDIFFVISGYLISNIIIDDYENKKFSIINFYERRVRRILPALFFVYLITVIFSSLLLYPDFLISFSKSLVSSFFFISNFFFIFETGYFSANANVQPLLHTWSLSIEEQFYLFFPLFFIFTYKKNIFFYSCIFLTILSFIICYQLGFYFRNANFLFSFSRFWQIFVGVLITILLRKNKFKLNTVINNILTFSGLILIIISLYLCNKNYFPQFIYPGSLSLIPIAGISLILISNNNKNLLFNLINFKFLIFIGLISYSLYLWHQPVFSFYKIIKNYSGINYFKNHIMENSFLFFLTFIISCLSWKFIEKPFRNRKIISLKLLNKLIISISIFFLIFAVIVFYSKGFINLYDDKIKNILLVDFSKSKNYIEKNFKKNLKEFEINNKNNVLFIGDSFTGDFLNILEELKILDNINYSNWIIRDSCFDKILIVKRYSDKCKKYDYNNDVKNLLEQADKIVFTFYWTNEMISTLFKLLNIINKSKDEIIVVGHKNFNLGLLDNRNQHYVYVDKLISKIKEKDKNLTLSKDLIYLNNILESKSDNYQFINLKKIYCNDKSCQIFNNEFELLTYDGGHLTKNGAVFFAEKLKHMGLLFYK